MPHKPSQSNSAPIPTDATLCDVATDKKAAKSLDNARKYPHVLTEHIWRHADGRHLLVLIRCQHPACNKQRLVATSDCFQVWKKDCGEHGERATPKTEKAAGERVSLRKGRKGVAKSRGARKGTRRAR